MKKKPKEPEEKLNNPVPEAVSPEEESYDLEDIIREFGGWTQREPEPKPEPEPEPESEPEPEPESEPEPQPASEERSEAKTEPAAVKEPGKPKFKLVDMSGDTIAFKTVTEEDLRQAAQQAQKEPDLPVEMPEEPAPNHADKRQAERAHRREQTRLRKQEAQRRKAQKAALRARRREEAETVYPSAEEAYVAYAKVGTVRLRLILCCILTVFSAVLLLLSQYSVGPLNMTGLIHPFSIVILALLLFQCVLSYEVFLSGIYQVLNARFDLNSLMTLTVIVSMADSFFAIGEGRPPFCTVAAISLLLALLGIYLEKKAKWQTLRTALSMENPVSASKVEKAWRGLDCVFRTEGSLEDFTAMLETPDAAKRIMRIYAPIAGVLTLLLAGFAALQEQVSFLWAWAALLTASLPGGGFIACCRPFSILAKKMSHDGAAICGWKGARILSGECGMVMEDQDLFPAASITMNGMKMYSEMPARQVVGYAAAVIKAAGSGLLPLFEEVMRNEGGRLYTADSFRQYEGGGLGAEIRGDVVLLGSLAFMRLMGVYVPEGVRVQSALYISVNQELVGIFALTYQPSAGTRSGLNRIMRSSGLTPVLATRDFMIMPALVKKRYKVPVERMEFPVVAERIQLSSKDAAAGGKQGALMAKGSFLSFASAVTGGRLLRRAVHSAVTVCMLSGIMGLILMGILTYLGSMTALTAANLLLYHLLWLLPIGLITGLVGKT